MAEAKVYWRRKALVLHPELFVRSWPVVLGRASVTTTEQDRRRRERATLRMAAEDVKEHILVFVAGRRFYGVFCSYKAASLVIEL